MKSIVEQNNSTQNEHTRRNEGNTERALLCPSLRLYGYADNVNTPQSNTWGAGAHRAVDQ